MLAIENIVTGDSGKKWIRDTFPSHSNYPMVCEHCAYPLGILHTDPITESLYLDRRVTWAEKNKSFKCPECETPHEIDQYLKADEENASTPPSEKIISLEKLAEQRKSELKEA